VKSATQLQTLTAAPIEKPPGRPSASKAVTRSTRPDRSPWCAGRPQERQEPPPGCSEAGAASKAGPEPPLPRQTRISVAGKRVVGKRQSKRSDLSGQGRKQRHNRCRCSAGPAGDGRAAPACDSDPNRRAIYGARALARRSPSIRPSWSTSRPANASAGPLLCRMSAGNQRFLAYSEGQKAP
jgi:hypothetical protein